MPVWTEGPGPESDDGTLGRAEAVAVGDRDGGELRDQLAQVFDTGDLLIAYQPKLCLQRGCYAGVEALLRRRRPDRAQDSGGSVIAAAEANGQIHALSLQILTRAIADQRSLSARYPDLRFAINISGDSLSNADFMERACRLAHDAAGPIGFEITETAFISDPRQALLNMRRLVAAGIELSIDDYGSGHSSLAYIKELPAAELKIDKLFVSGMTRSNRDPLIVRSTIDLAHALGMRVVAEGVESHATLALLRAMGCDMAQGFFISPALNLDDLTRFLGDGEHLRRLNDQQISLRPSSTFWVRNENDRSTKDVDGSGPASS